MSAEQPEIREVMNEQQIQQAIDTCAQEKIHIPGAIQPHGYLIALDEDFNIRQISKNITSILGGSANSFLGVNLSSIVDDNKIKELKGLTSEGTLNPIRSTVITLQKGSNTLYFDAIIHKSDSKFVLELEPFNNADNGLRHQNFYNDVMRFSVHLQKIDSQQLLNDYLVTEIRRITGLARVKLYKFDEEWNGNVVAESKAAHMPSYLGLTFPHTDIPKQARALYAKNYLRLISDVNYEPVDILSNDHEPLNLSFSVLRSVSPVHMQYLANMGVQASMSISIMQNDKLWGLVACHHHEPYYAPYPVRMAAELIGHTFSAFLSNLAQTDKSIQERERHYFINELRISLSPNVNLIEVLKHNNRSLLDSVKADGMTLFIGGKYFSFGLAPDAVFSKKLTAWLEEHYDGRIFSSNSIGRDTNIKCTDHEQLCGVLAVPVSKNMKDYVIWFRREKSEEVHWAGKPEKNITEKDTGYHLTPRASFGRWKQNVRGLSKPWTNTDIEVGLNISKLLLAKKYEDLLRQKNEDLQSVMNNSSALIYISSVQGDILTMNESAINAFDLNVQTLIGKNFRDIFDDDVATVFEASHSDVLASQESMTFQQDFSYAGKEFHLLSVNFPLYDVTGELYAICTMATDISSLRKTESDLIQSNKELERMAFIASHDLQEPLRHIAIFIQRLNEDYGDKLDDTAQQYIDFSLSAAKRMKNLIVDLLQYSHLKHEEKNYSAIDPTDSLEEIIKEFEIMHAGEDMQIVRPKNLPKIYMSPEHFYCVVQNLIGNALKYRDKTRSPRINITVEEQEFKQIFCVKDNGIGIKEKYFEKIFMIFQRLHTNSEFNGTGIGLALVKRVLDKYDGSLWLESEYGVGSCFYFSLPKLQPQEIGQSK